MSTQIANLDRQLTQINFPLAGLNSQQPKVDNESLLSFSNNADKTNNTNKAESDGISFWEGAEIVFQGAKDNLVNKVKDTINMFKEDPLKATVVTCAGLAIGAGVLALGMSGSIGAIISGAVLAGAGGYGLFNQAKDVYEEVENIKEADGDEEEIREALYNIGGSVEEGIEDVALLAAGLKQVKAGVSVIKAASSADDVFAAMQDTFSSAYAQAEAMGKVGDEAAEIGYATAQKVYATDVYNAQFDKLFATRDMDFSSGLAGIIAGLTKQDDIQESLG